MPELSHITGAILLQVVAERIISRYLRAEGMKDVSSVTLNRRNGFGDGVDMTYSRLGHVMKVKVKADPYFGLDPQKISDMTRSFYRPDNGDYALEVVAHHLTREPGWVFRSDADELFYYLIALDQSEGEVAALIREQDDVFFEGLRVARDDLRILPMDDVRDWFSLNQAEYASRPIQIGTHSAWYRLIPRVELERVIPSVTRIGSIFDTVR